MLPRALSWTLIDDKGPSPAAAKTSALAPAPSMKTRTSSRFQQKKVAGPQNRSRGAGVEIIGTETRTGVGQWRAHMPREVRRGLPPEFLRFVIELSDLSRREQVLGRNCVSVALYGDSHKAHSVKPAEKVSQTLLTSVAKPLQRQR